MPETFHTALDAVPQTILLYQPDQILYVNRTAAALIGCSPDEAIGLRFEDLFESSSEVDSSTSYLKTRNGRVPVTLMREAIELEGAQIQMITALRHGQPDPAPTDSQRFLESIFESTAVGIAIMDEQAFYVRVNRTYSEIYGYTPEEMVGRHFFLIFPPELQAEAQDRHERFIRGETPGIKSDWTVVRKDGRRIEVSAFNNRMISETGARFRVVVVIEITEQKLAQQELQETQERLFSILNSMGDAVWSVKAETHELTFVNPAIETLTGYSVDEFMNREGLLFDIIHPEDRATFFEQMQKASSGAQIDLEHRIIRRDGQVRWIHKRFWLVSSLKGDRIGGLMTDITDRKLAVEQAMQLKLENERIRILSSFMRSASHEFRTPLSIINLRLDMMERHFDPEMESRYVQPIRRQASRILNLVDALMLMSRLDAIESLQLEPIHLGKLLNTIAGKHEAQIRQKGIAFTVEIAPEALFILGEIFELESAINALFNNAIVHTPAGGRIDVRCYRFNPMEAAVEVADTGVGISEGNLPRIFERFYRVDQAHSTEGIGLGLAIAKRIIELHYGRIEVESAVGEGSRFRLIFPVKPVQ